MKCVTMQKHYVLNNVVPRENGMQSPGQLFQAYWPSSVEHTALSYQQATTSHKG